MLTHVPSIFWIFHVLLYFSDKCSFQMSYITFITCMTVQWYKREHLLYLAAMIYSGNVSKFLMKNAINSGKFSWKYQDFSSKYCRISLDRVIKIPKEAELELRGNRVKYTAFHRVYFSGWSFWPAQNRDIERRKRGSDDVQVHWVAMGKFWAKNWIMNLSGVTCLLLNPSVSDS